MEIIGVEKGSRSSYEVRRGDDERRDEKSFRDATVNG